MLETLSNKRPSYERLLLVNVIAKDGLRGRLQSGCSQL